MSSINRRTLLASAAASFVAAPAFSAAQPYVVPEQHKVRIVTTKSGFRPGEIHVDPGNFALYWTLPDNKAVRYIIGIGVEGRYYAGSYRVQRKVKWPSWTPTKNMIRREPHLYAKHAAGMPGGPNNPLGARALYLYKGSRDSLLRIHGTPRPQSIAARVSNGCIRMINSHVEDLYNRVPNGTRVVLH